MPAIVFFGPGASGNHIMDVRMVIQCSAPGVQNSVESQNIYTDEFFILYKRFHGFGGRFEKSVIGNFLIFSEKASNRLRYAESDHEIGAWNLIIQLVIEPVQPLLILACWTMSVSTRA